MSASEPTGVVVMRDADQQCVVRIYETRPPDPSPALPLDLAYRIVLAGLEAALTAGEPQTIVVVDAGGELLAVGCLPGAGPQTQALAASKAFTACTIGFDTRRLVDASLDLDVAAEQRLAAVVAGGTPIRSGTAIVGGIGVSGGDAASDHATAATARAAAGDACAGLAEARCPGQSGAMRPLG
jgi:glc operon protein GlcG